uniref:Uncharacterized protein n=1 Tax=Plectus sambesii TaxID=2011161 RepID=A0A914XA59_9BILA
MTTTTNDELELELLDPAAVATIVALCEDVNAVESNMERANHDLDFVAQQQQELGDIIAQMETALGVDDWSNGTAIGSMTTTHSDLQREMIMNLQTAVDGQTKQIGQDLAQLVEQVNAVRGGTAGGDDGDVMQQIALILSKQMDTLTWVDQHTGALEAKLNDVKAELNRRRRTDHSGIIRYG